MGGIRYDYPYTSCPPTAVYFARSAFYPFFRDGHGPDFERINAAQGTSLTAAQRSERLWGSRRYRDSIPLVLEEDGLVGLLKAQPNTGREVIAETLDAFLSVHGLDQFVIHGDEQAMLLCFLMKRPRFMFAILRVMILLLFIVMLSVKQSLHDTEKQNYKSVRQSQILKGGVMEH